MCLWIHKITDAGFYNTMTIMIYDFKAWYRLQFLLYNLILFCFYNACYLILIVVLMAAMLLFTDNAYGKTLRQYHGWVVRGVFAVSLTLVTFKPFFFFLIYTYSNFTPYWNVCGYSWHWGQLLPMAASWQHWYVMREMSWRRVLCQECTVTLPSTCQPWRSSWPSWMLCMRSTAWSQTRWCESTHR